MGKMASANVIAIPMIDKHTDPEPAAARASAPQISRIETSRTATSADASAPVASEVPVPAPEPIPTVSLRKVLRDLLARVTRERLISAALACISIGTLFLCWYLGTKYKFEFYI